MRTSWIGPVVVLVALVAPALGAGPPRSPLLDAVSRQTIPPEVLKQYDQDILLGNRPTYARIEQKDILALREKPKFSADFVVLDFDPSRASTVQREVLRDWVASGSNRVLLVGTDLGKYGPILGMCAARHEVPSAGIGTLASLHVPPGSAVAPDVARVSTRCEAAGPGPYPGHASVYWHAVDIGRTPEVTPAALYTDNLAAAGLCEVGQGQVYFFPGGPLADGDAERFRLNFLHWALGLKVPGPVWPPPPVCPVPLPPRVEGADVILMDNGDTILGTVTDPSFGIKTPYAALDFGVERIERIVLRRAPANADVLTLRVGSTFSGTVVNETVTVRLATGGEVQLPKARIREIRFGPIPPTPRDP